MPYQKSPTYSTYETKRVGLNYNIESRNWRGSTGTSTSADAYLENAIVDHLDKDDEKPVSIVMSRPGCVNISGNYSSVGRGCYAVTTATDSVIVFYVVADKVYTNLGGYTGTTLTTSSGPIGWTEFLTSVGTRYVILSDGIACWYFTIAGVGTKIVDVDMPTPHVPCPIFLDGYLFLAKANSNDIYNSDLDTPANWTAGNYISAEMYPDYIVSLAKNNNYIYAIGTNSIEFFYDNANTTSPLQRYGSAVLQMGCAWPETVVQTDKEVILVASTDAGGRSVWAIDGFKPTEISTPALCRQLEAVTGSDATAYSIRVAGHKLYLLYFNSKTFVYDFTTKLWYYWSTDTLSGYFGRYGTDGRYGNPYIQGAEGALAQLGINYPTDNNSLTFTTTIQTPKLDFDTFNRKTMSRFSLMGGETQLGTENTYSISWSDDDYQTWSTPRNITFETDFPSIAQLGSFRRRAFKITIDNTRPWILNYFEVDINKGSQ